MDFEAHAGGVAGVLVMGCGATTVFAVRGCSAQNQPIIEVDTEYQTEPRRKWIETLIDKQ